MFAAHKNTPSGYLPGHEYSMNRTKNTENAVSVAVKTFLRLNIFAFYAQKNI